MDIPVLFIVPNKFMLRGSSRRVRNYSAAGAPLFIDDYHSVANHLTAYGRFMTVMIAGGAEAHRVHGVTRICVIETFWAGCWHAHICASFAFCVSCECVVKISTIGGLVAELLGWLAFLELEDFPLGSGGGLGEGLWSAASQRALTAFASNSSRVTAAANFFSVGLEPL
jgi:hypothetical protein